MASLLDLNRASFLTVGGSVKKPALDFLSPKYLNIRYLLPPTKSYTVDSSDQANAPGISRAFYGSVDYWWVVCMYNGILDPITEFVPGSVLQLPDLSDINAFLSAQDTQQLDVAVTI